MSFLFLLLIPVWCAAQETEVLRGTIRDAQSGEPVARARVTMLCGQHRWTVDTDAAGKYELRAPAEPGCLLEAAAVGFRPLRTGAVAGAGMDLGLTPEYLVRQDRIEVQAGPFEPVVESSPSERTLTGVEMKSLGGVLADDPLRAVQSLPGVSSNNEYAAQFSLRGAGFSQVGLYLDGLLLHSPFHAVQTQASTGSLTLFPGDVIEEMSLHLGAPPVRYADRSAAALDVQLRDGWRENARVRVNAGVAGVGLVAEGPWARGRGSWLTSARKSFLQYLLRRSAAEDSLAFGFVDWQTRVAYDLTSRQRVHLTVLDGLSDLDRSRGRDRLGLNAIMLSDYRMTVGSAAWSWTPSSDVTVTQRGAWLREQFENRNPGQLALQRGRYGEWIANTDAQWQMSARAGLSAGVSFRRLRDGGFLNRYQFNPLAIRRRETWDGTAWRSGGYIGQNTAAWGGRLRLSGGARWDGSTATAPRAISPHGSLTGRIGSGTRLQAAWSQSVQYPELALLTLCLTGDPALLPLRASHLVVGAEQSMTSRTRLRVEFYQRRERDLIFQPLLEPRLLPDGRIFTPASDPRWMNSARGRARGVEVFLQRRSANGVSGWIAYNYGHARWLDGVTGSRSFTDFDQRHGLNGYASYRLRAVWLLSTRYAYGSNFPVPGFLREEGGRYFLATERNQVRLPAYQRLDMRLSRSFQRDRWRGTFYAEVVNLTNRANRRYDSFGGYRSGTGEAFPRTDKLFPILPAAGVTFEWDARAWQTR
jgi:hypothetical protein